MWCVVPEYDYVKVCTCVRPCGSQSKTAGVFSHCSLPYCLEKGSVTGPEQIGDLNSGLYTDDTKALTEPSPLPLVILL